MLRVKGQYKFMARNDFSIGNRRQFPVKPAFATTVNKSQGQTLKYVGIRLRTPTFTHGQLYVACFRVGKPEQLKFAIKLDSLGNVPRVNNVVFQEVLLDK